MKIETVREAIIVAQEFVKRAKFVEAIEEQDKSAFNFGCKETASLRRASMELTRLLADLRMGR